MRRRYIDNIRWTTVVLVVFYHVIFLYSAIEPELGLGPFRPVQYQDAFPYIVYPWFMALLFVVSGISSRLYLESHTGKEYLGSRTRKLLVPSTLGLFVFQWIQGYVSMGISGGVFDGLPFFVRYLILVASGTGVLWFIQLCWVYSAALLLVRKAEKDRLYSLCGKFPTWALVLLVFPLWGASKILNAPMVIVYRVGFYGFCFFLGYFVFAHKELVDRLAKAWLPLSAAAVCLCVLFLVTFWGKPYAHHQVLDTFLCNAYAWSAILAVFAMAKRFWDRESPFGAWMRSWSWGLYVFHYLGISACGYWLDTLGVHTPWVCYPAVTAAGFVGAYVLYQIISRIPVLRWCVLGYSPRLPLGEGAAAAADEGR